MIEIYACKFDIDSGIISSEFETFVKPSVPVPEFITEITGITNSMLKDAPTFVEIYDDLCKFFLGETILFAHNAAFDVGIIVNELRRYDWQYKFPWPKTHYCTVELTECIKNKRLKLDALFQIAKDGNTRYGQHRARQDVIDMVECIKWMREHGFV